MPLKPIARELIKAVLPSSQTPILVASMGRSGSTLVYDSLVEGMASRRFGTYSSRLHGLIRDTAWRLDGARYRNGRVYKTHDLPEDIQRATRPIVVFLFGSASGAARSVINCDNTYGRDWIEEHLLHLRASGGFDEIPDHDILRFGEQLNSWLSCEELPVLALKYEELWNSGAEQQLSNFVGFPVRLPARRARQSAAVDLGPIGSKLAATYAEIDARVDALPAVSINELGAERIQLNRDGE